MPRTTRNIGKTGGTYHIVARGNNKAYIFLDELDFNAYLFLIAENKKKFPFLLHHYALMDNHVHLMVSTERGYNIPAAMKAITQGYALHYNKKYRHVGHIWQNRYKSYVINSEQYLLTCGVYIELNPVRADIVRKPTDYQWSSSRFYLRGEVNKLIDPDPLFLSSGRSDYERRVEYGAVVDAWLLHGLDRKKAAHYFKGEPQKGQSPNEFSK